MFFYPGVRLLNMQCVWDHYHAEKLRQPIRIQPQKLSKDFGSTSDKILWQYVVIIHNFLRA